MAKLAVDTCVVFKMVGLHQIYLESGMEGLRQAQIADEEDMMKEELEILDIIEPIAAHLNKFDKKGENQSLNRFVDRFKERVGQYKKRVGSDATADAIDAEIAKVVDKNKDLIAEIERIIKEREDKKIQKKIADGLLPEGYVPPSPTKVETVWDKLDKLLNYRLEYYKKLSDYYNMNQLLQDSMAGKVDLYITETVYEEVRNHFKEKHPEKIDSDFILFDSEQVHAFTREHLTFIRTKGTAVRKLIDKTAAEYRGENDFGIKGSPMKPDVNSVNKYGDSLIMAETNLAGISLVTTNVKDFIDPSGLREKNDTIRQYMKLLAKNDTDLTEALPCKLTEAVKGDFREPQSCSNAVTVSSAENKEEQFKDTNEMSI